MHDGQDGVQNAHVGFLFGIVPSGVLRGVHSGVGCGAYNTRSSQPWPQGAGAAQSALANDLNRVANARSLS
jgi:hypothetical protein